MAPTSAQFTDNMNSKKLIALPQTRASREGGQKTRITLIEAAAKLFLQSGFDQVSVTDIAAAAEAFPNHITYHFGGKDALFVEAASHAMLRTAKQAERITRKSDSIESHARVLIAHLLGPGAPAVMLFAEAMLLARRKSTLGDCIRRTLATLNEAGETAMVETLMRTGWKTTVLPATITRGFWAAIFGLALEKAATGQDFEYESAEAVALLMMNLDLHRSPAP